MENNLIKVLEKFEDYCTNDIISGKARSYKLAISYLCDFLNIFHMDKNNLGKIRDTAEELKEINSSMYRECLKFLAKRRQSSYLSKGWINAAVKHFLRFMNLEVC